MSVIVTLLCILTYSNLEYVNAKTTTPTEKFCRDRNRLITSNKDDFYDFVEASLGEKLVLMCHFWLEFLKIRKFKTTELCFSDEKDDNHPKNWFKLDSIKDSIIYEVELGMENNMSLNRLHTDLEHSLIIHNVSEDDAGEYFCRGLDNDEVANKYNFFVDVTFKIDIQPEKGNISLWKIYHDENIIPINKFLNTSKNPEVTFLKEKMQLKLEILTEWGKPSPCDACGRPKGYGLQTTNGYCRFKIYNVSKEVTKVNNFQEKMLLRATHLSCRSISLQKLIPDIINRTLSIPEFLLIENCDGMCNPDAEGHYKGWKTSKKKGYKYSKTFVLAENAHLTLVCPDSTLENKVVWKTKGRLIKPGYHFDILSPHSEPRIIVDTFNTLYLYGVTKEEEGNYTCYVDGARMQSVRVFVVSKAKLLTQAFVRHMMYLAFVLSLTLTCYFAGLVITCTKRKQFKTYDEIVEELRDQNQLLSDDDDAGDVEQQITKEESSVLESSPFANSPETSAQDNKDITVNIDDFLQIPKSDETDFEETKEKSLEKQESNHNGTKRKKSSFYKKIRYNIQKGNKTKYEKLKNESFQILSERTPISPDNNIMKDLFPMVQIETSSTDSIITKGITEKSTNKSSRKSRGRNLKSNSISFRKSMRKSVSKQFEVKPMKFPKDIFKKKLSAIPGINRFARSKEQASTSPSKRKLLKNYQSDSSSPENKNINKTTSFYRKMPKITRKHVKSDVSSSTDKERKFPNENTPLFRKLESEGTSSSPERNENEDFQNQNENVPLFGKGNSRLHRYQRK